MGRLVHRVLGDSQGKVGELVFKIYNGKVYITTHKGFNKISKSPSCVKNRNRFAVSVKFSKAVNSLNNLKEVWSQSNAEGKRTYTKILRFNIGKLLDGKLSKLNSIVPAGFSVDAKDLVFSKKSLKLSLKITDEENNYSEILFKLNFVVALLTNDKEVLNNAFPYLCFSVDFTADNNSNYKNITVNFNKYQIELLSKFQKARVFLALTNTDVDPCINSCSASFDECSIK
jgi:hypothetical protein